MHGYCRQCNKYGNLTRHHLKYRTGQRVCYYLRYENYLKTIFVTSNVCRKCHDIIEEDYRLTGRAAGNIENMYEQIDNFIMFHDYIKPITVYNFATAMYKRGKKKDDPSLEISYLKKIKDLL